MKKMNRDSAVWWVGMIGGVAMAFAAHADMFPWFPEWLNRVIEVTAFIAAITSGKLANSPLKSKSKLKGLI
jgi:hypothetical protein